MHKTLTKIFLILSIFILILTPIRILFAAENSISPRVELNTPIPGANGATEVVQNLGDYLGKIYNFGIAIAGILAFVMITVGGIMYVSSTYTGNVVKGQSGKSYIESALLGLAVALLSYLFIYTIDPELTHPKYVFEAIPDAVCVGGYGNTESEQKCQEMCTVGSLKTKGVFDNNTKCCKCDAGASTCMGENSYSGFPLASCESVCNMNCPKEQGKICKVASGSSEGCCKCEIITQIDDSALKCSGNGTKITSSAQCATYCSGLGNAVYDTQTQCCNCKALAAPSAKEECVNSCKDFCESRGFGIDTNKIKFDPSTKQCECGNCL